MATIIAMNPQTGIEALSESKKLFIKPCVKYVTSERTADRLNIFISGSNAFL